MPHDRDQPPGDDERVDALRTVLRTNGIGGPTRLNPYVPADPADWISRPARGRFTRAVWVCLGVVVFLVIGVPLLALAVDALS